MVARSRSTCHYSTSIEGMIQNRKLQSTSCGLLEKDARTGTEEEVGGGERIDPHERKHETRRRDLASRGIKTWTLAAVPTTKEERERKTGQRLSNSRSSNSRCARFDSVVESVNICSLRSLQLESNMR